MLFTFNTTDDAVRIVYELAQTNRLSSTQFGFRLFDDDWTHCCTDAMPSWTEVAQHLAADALTACVVTAKSVNGRLICVRWDREYIGGSVLRWESDHPVNEAEDDIFNRLYWASNMSGLEV